VRDFCTRARNALGLEDGSIAAVSPDLGDDPMSEVGVIEELLRGE
jgi:hypothetical protein